MCNVLWPFVPTFFNWKWSRWISDYHRSNHQISPTCQNRTICARITQSHTHIAASTLFTKRKRPQYPWHRCPWRIRRACLVSNARGRYLETHTITIPLHQRRRAQVRCYTKKIPQVRLHSTTLSTISRRKLVHKSYWSRQTQLDLKHIGRRWPTRPAATSNIRSQFWRVPPRGYETLSHWRTL